MDVPEIPPANLSFLNVPVEIRLSIYSHLFKSAKVVLDAGNPPASQTCLIPEDANTGRRLASRSSQLLRVCKTILYEARPVLYSRTTFHITTHTFAGSLPSSLTNGHPIARHARNVVWQVDCDILKRYYLEDFAFRQGDLDNLDSLEVIAKVDTWKGSFCGEDCDRDGFVQGRNSMLEYGKLVLGQFCRDGTSSAQLVEDQRLLGKGEVRLRLGRGNEKLSSTVSPFNYGAYHRWHADLSIGSGYLLTDRATIQPFIALSRVSVNEMKPACSIDVLHSFSQQPSLTHDT
jgi:hypothetical protein